MTLSRSFDLTGQPASNFSTCTRRSIGLNGFVINASAPPWAARSAISGWAWAVSTRTLTLAESGSCRSWLRTSQPSRPGRPISSTTTVGFVALICSSPVTPSTALDTSTSSTRRHTSINLLTDGESSITSTFWSTPCHRRVKAVPSVFHPDVVSLGNGPMRTLASLEPTCLEATC